MQVAAIVVAVLVAIAHVYFLVLEMFLWRTPYGRRTFGMTTEQAEATAVLAGNQGLYNGFLAAGIAWALLAYPFGAGRPVLSFFLVCVVIAGVYGGFTANRRILFVQALPAVIALVLTWLA